LKKGFVERKEKVYPLSREERGEKGVYRGATKKRVY